MIHLITGNVGKLEELRSLLPPEVDITHRKLDLVEIQSLDLHEIVSHKLRQAYEVVDEPVIVEDVSAELDSLRSLPGPFIKFFMQRLGDDALFRIGAPHDAVKIMCTMGYYDGEKEIIVDGVMTGHIVVPRGNNGFGFDAVVVPDGYDRTLAELTSEEKNAVSHRRRAVDSMVSQLKKAGIC